MPKANTYRVERLLGPYGFSIPDVYVVEGNNRRPVVFKKIGDSIDLNKVGISAMVRSALGGQINRLLVSGVLSTMFQEVSQEKFNELQTVLADLGMKNLNDSPMAAPVKYVSLEPGVMVAVSQVPDPASIAGIEIIQPQPVVEELTAQLEPGLVAPTGAAGRQNVQALDAPASEPAKAKGTKKSSKKQAEASAPAPATAEVKNPFAEWKFNLDFQAQKRAIVDSTDKAFLQWVAGNDDSIQFQKLAQTRLADGSF